MKLDLRMLFAFIAIGCITQQSIAQKSGKPKINWAKDVNSNAYSYTYYCGDDEENYYILDLNFQVLGKGSAELHSYAKGKKSSQQTATISEDGANRFDMASLGGVVIGGAPHVYEREWNDDKKCYALKLTEIDPGSLKRTNNTFYINELDKHKSSKNDVVYTQIAHSDNGEYTAIYTSSTMGFNLSEYMRIYPGISFVMQFFSRSKSFYIRSHAVTVFDKKGNEVWTNSYVLGEKKRFVTMSDFGLTNEGDVYFFGDEYYSNSMLTSMEYSYSYGSKYTNIYTLKRDSDQPKIIELDWEDGWSIENSYSYKDGSFLCAGSIMKEAGRKNVFHGVGIQEISFDGDVKHKLEMPMDISYFGKELTKSEKRRLEKGKSVNPSIGIPLIHYVKQTEDGGYIVCAEERLLHETTTVRTNSGTGQSTSSTDFDYEFKNAVVFKVSATGKSEWKQVIEKNQYLSSMYWQGSVFIAEKDDAIVLIFNDEIAKDKTFNASKAAKFLHFVEVNQIGEVVMDQKVKGQSAPIAPIFCYQNENEIILMGHNSKVRCFGLHSLE